MSKNMEVSEVVFMTVERVLQRFHCSDEQEVEFPTSLSSAERAFIHHVARTLGYSSKSRGKGLHRFVTVRKTEESDRAASIFPLTISHSSLLAVRSLLQRFPCSKRECSDMQLCSGSSHVATEHGWANILSSGVAVVPLKRARSELDGFRRSLPVYKQQEEVVQLIRHNKVVLVVGRAGSGKTTQIPQFLLDDCSARGEPCRIFCIQPRRLAAVAAAERVAAERGESVGQTVAYQVGLETRLSQMSVLIFCTSWVFVRSLMDGDDTLTSVTHLIMDEVEERDGLTDLLLIKLRDVLPNIPTLKLIVSSAALDVHLLTRYLGSCPVIQLREQQFEVTELFLEDILRGTGFNAEDKKEEQQQCLTECCEAVDRCSVGELHWTHTNRKKLGEKSPEMDSCVSRMSLHGDQLFQPVLHGGMTPPRPASFLDRALSEAGTPPLTVAAGGAFLPLMERRLNPGADVSIKRSSGWALEAASSLDGFPLECVNTQPRCEEQEPLTLDHNGLQHQWVELEFIMALLHHICSSSRDGGSVLVFLPGYEDMVLLRDRILRHDKSLTTHSERLQVFMLHSDMLIQDQRAAMTMAPPGFWKIILSSSIAETSITINDVVWVIDSGKVKERCWDPLSHVSTLKPEWVSKASAVQRKGRAGRCRPGVCFRLFSRLRFSNMPEYQVPQLLRMPLQELCLHARLLAPSWYLISEFLSKAPQPPPPRRVRDAVQMLTMMDALDENEDLTHLGLRLARLPVAPHLGKMVLCAVVLQCLDPVLTVACALACGQPFTVPTHSSQKRRAQQSHKHFSANSFSDHMALLRVFQAWQDACKEEREKSFCEENWVSPGAMDMILAKRTQLLGHLRAMGLVQAHRGMTIREVNRNSENWAVVKAALVAGASPNLAHVDRETSALSSGLQKTVLFHPTSVLSPSPSPFKEPGSAKSSPALPTDWLVYEQMSRGQRSAQVHCCSLVTPVTVAVFGGDPKTQGCSVRRDAEKSDGPQEDISDSEEEEEEEEDDEEQARISVDQWIVFRLDKEAAAVLFELRQQWLKLLARRIRQPTRLWSPEDEAVVQTLVSVLAAEEKAACLPQPTGIGRVPRNMVERGLRSSGSSPNAHRGLHPQ